MARFQIIIYESVEAENPIDYYINYDSNLYSPELVEKFSNYFKEALSRMIREDSL